MLNIGYYSAFNWEKQVFKPKVLFYFYETVVYQ